MSNPGYAVKKDETFWRVVDGPVPDPDLPDKVYMDPETEYFMSFEDGPPPSPIPTPAELASTALAECDRLLAIAAIRIAPLQDAVDLGKANDEVKALLKAWKEYRVDLNEIPQSPTFPSEIVWPLVPS